MLPCYTDCTAAGTTLKAPADLSQQTRLVTLRRKEGLCVLGSDREAGRHPVVVVKGALVEGEGGEGMKPALKFDFHLRQCASLSCTRPLHRDTAGMPWETPADRAARAEAGVLSCHITSRLVSAVRAAEQHNQCLHQHRQHPPGDTRRQPWVSTWASSEGSSTAE